MVIFIYMKKIDIDIQIMDQIIDMYINQKIGTPTISKKFNIHKSIVLNHLKKLNIPIEKHGGRWKGGKSESDKRYRDTHKVYTSKKHKMWALKNKEKIKEYHKKWRTGNKDYYQKKIEYEKKRKNSDPIYKLNTYLKTALYTSLKEKSIIKNSKTFNILNFSLNDLKIHLENQFINGMTWENYGEWHVDHILPISHFNLKSIDSIEFKECWALSNLRPMWAKDNLSKNNKILSHQYKIRVQKSKEELIDFDVQDVLFKNSSIRIIDRKICETVINEYEWLGYLPKYTNYHFGLFFKINDKEYLGGVVALQPEYGENMGVWDKYGYTGKIIQLSRGVCLWWTPKNSASYMISKIIKFLKKNTKYEILTATVDGQAGEIGTIYQALGWYYIGCMGGNIMKSGKERIRYSYRINGKLYNQRHLRKMIGSASKENVLKHYPDVEIFNSGRKKRYFKFIKNQNQHLKSIITLIKPYPKR